MRVASVLILTMGVLGWVPGVGHGACLPDDPQADPQPLGQPQPGGTVICSGGDVDGFSRLGINDLRVIVQPGADIAGIALYFATGLSVSVVDGGRVHGSGPVNVPAINLVGTGGSSISNAGRIETSPSRTPAILASGFNLTIDSSGVIQTGGGESPAIEVPDVFQATIANSGQIVTVGNESDGIEAYGSAIFVGNVGTIQTGGRESPAVYLEGARSADSLISVTNTGTLKTVGEESEGVFVYAGGVTVRNEGIIKTSGFVASGILVEGIEATIQNSGRVTTSGMLAPALGSIGGGSMLTNTGTLETTGMDASGMQVGVAILGVSLPSDGNGLTNAGTIDVRGVDAHGLLAIGTGNTLTNALPGGIVAAGPGSSGMQVGISIPGLAVDADRNVLRNRGTITTAGSGGHGLYAAGAGNDLSNEGTIRVQGSGGNGLGAAGAGNTLTNTATGRIVVLGGAEGMRYDGSSGVATNAGFIEASATGGEGISMFGSSMSATNSGRIEVTGGGTGIRVSGESGFASNQDTGVIVTTADSSAGIWMVQGGRIVNFGEVLTFGADASGLVVSGSPFAGGGFGRVTNDGTVSTLGPRSHGIEVGRAHALTSGRVNQAGSVVTNGAEADGIHVTAEGLDVVVGPFGGIVTSGSGADGVELRGGGNTLDNLGTIQVLGAGSAGVRLESTGVGQMVFNSGTIASAGNAIAGSDGTESIFNAGSIEGNVRLAGGNDYLRVSERSSISGLADGGSGGVDELEAEIVSIDTLRGGQFIGFETFRKTGTGLLGVQETLSIDLGLVDEGVLVIQSGSTLRAGVGVTVAGGATLAGSGTVEGDVVVDPGGYLAPGLSVGTITITDDLILQGILAIEVGGSRPGESDLVRVHDQADLGAGQILLSFVDAYRPALGDSFLILEAGLLIGLDEVALSHFGLPSEYSFSLLSVGDNGLAVITTAVAAVPEPSSVILLLLGGSMLLVTERRRSRGCARRSR